MTVSTPFPRRPATPWLVNTRPTPLGDFDISTVTGPITDVFRTLHESDPGMYTVQNADGSVITYRQMPGSGSLPVGNVTGNLNTGIAGSVSTGSGVWILIAIGAVLLLAGKRR